MNKLSSFSLCKSETLFTDIPSLSNILSTRKKLCLVSPLIRRLSDVVEPGGNVSLYEYIKKMVIMQRQNEALNNALVSVTNELRKSENFVIFKTGTDLEKALSW